MATAHHILDLLFGLGLTISLWASFRSGNVPRRHWRLFWLGVTLGLLWELPIFVLSEWTSWQLVDWPTPLPLHSSVFLVVHSLWDGLILLAGYGLAARLAHRFDKSTTSAVGLAVMLLWGQSTALLVELSALAAGTWKYVEGRFWNPTLFHLGDEPVVLLPQAVWILAPLIFWTALRFQLFSREATPDSVTSSLS